MLAAAILAVAYLIVAPSPADLAAQTFRADLFSAHGPLIWNDLWYSGHSLPAYSLVYPPLGALLGPRLVGVIAAVASGAAFGALARRRYGAGAAMAVAWFGAATVTNLISGRITFALGLAVALAAALALQRRRVWLAVALAILASLASPLAGLFLVLGAWVVAWVAPGERRRAAGVGAAALGSLLALSLAFPTAGWFPFAWSAFLPVPVAVAAVLIFVPRDESWLRVGAVVYGLLCLALVLVHTPVGANATRLGSLFAGPLLALALIGRRPLVLAALALPLLYWQWVAPIRDFVDQDGDPATARSYFSPLLAELGRVVRGPVRIEIPPTHDRWESAYVAPRYPLARGWLRQLEVGDLDRFTGGSLTAAAYRRWLDRRAVSYVAVPDAKLDYLAEDEAALIEGGLGYLRPIWRGAHWTLYRVRRSTPLVSPGGASLAGVGPADFDLTVRRPGPYLVRIHYTPYWTVTGGDACVRRAGPWTAVAAKRPGTVGVSARFSVGGLLRTDSSC